MYSPNTTGKRTITGMVTDESGEPLIGATVVLKGTPIGVSVDFVPRRRRQTHQFQQALEELKAILNGQGEELRLARQQPRHQKLLEELVPGSSK